MTLVLAWAVAWLHASAQQLEPRAYSNTPVGMNFLITAYGYSDGDVSTDASAPVQNAKVQTDTALVGYARSFGVFGKSAKFDIIEGLAWVSGQADFVGQPRSRDVTGFIDPRFHVSVNFYGSPALTMNEFTNYHQNLILGASLAVTPPVGRYDTGKLLNIGNNRWSFRPELGLSKAVDRFTFEVMPAVTFFTDNDDFLGKVRSQDPLFSLEGHVIYSFTRGLWASVDGTYYTGASTTLGGVNQYDPQENVRTGATLSLPLGRHQSIKLYGSTGVYSRTGSDFWIAGIAFQYRWGGGL